MTELNIHRLAATAVMCVVVVLLSVQPARAFGKNKVQYDQFEWKYVYTRHFKVFFYDGGRHVADFAADVAERFYTRLSKRYDYTLKRRIPLVIYKSHNDFKQTNIIMEMLEEETGGFTEIFKNRVVLPYQGSYEELRHVVEHELNHAVMFEMIYGSNIFETLYNVQNLMPVPLWFMEGCSEYQSLDWNVRSDMVLRDAIINDHFRSIEQVRGYLYYKGGQSFIRYIAKNYGDDKIGDIIRVIRVSKNIDKALKSVLGVGLEEVDKDWMRELRKQYWPELRYRDEPEQIGRRFTDHMKDNSYFNVAPKICPKGDKLVFFSDRRDYVDVYLMSAIDGTMLGRLVEGERSSTYESFNWLKARLTWAPDSRRIAFVATSGGGDVLYVYDSIDKKTVASYPLAFDAVTSPVWSPQDERIVFSGMRNGHTDLYLLDLESRHVSPVTDDAYDDIDPDWSGDGSRLVFASDRDWRAPAGDSAAYPDRYGTYNIFTYNFITGSIEAVTRDPYNNTAPSWHPDSLRLVYVSEYNGVPNLLVCDADGGNTMALTNTLTGCFTPDWSPDGKKVVFTQYDNSGWDVYMIRNPEDGLLPLDVIEPTPFVSMQQAARVQARLDSLGGDTDSLVALPDSAGAAVAVGALAAASASDSVDSPRKPGDSAQQPGDTASLSLADMPDSAVAAAADDSIRSGADSIALQADTAEAAQKPVVAAQAAGTDTAHKPAAAVQEQGDTVQVAAAVEEPAGPRVRRPARDYTLEFSPDIVSLQFYASTFAGPAGFLYLAFSDVLGNHRFNVYLQSRQLDVNTLDFNLSYYYLPHRLDMGAGGFHETNLYAFNDSTLFSDRLYGASLMASYPFNKFNRVEAGLDVLRIERTHLDYELNEIRTEQRQVFQPMLQYANDTVIWGYTGPVNGMRGFLRAQYSHKLTEASPAFLTLMGDWRRYLRFQKKYNLVFRLSGGQSYGEDRQVFYMGGTRNYWAGSGISSTLDEDAVWGVDNFYFGHYIAPLRGVKLYDVEGNGYLLANFEFRYPFIRYLVMGWPLGLALQNIRGSIFMDVASVWPGGLGADDLSFGAGSVSDKVTTTSGIGFGGRLNVGFAVLRMDVAWETDFDDIAHKPYYYFSLGGEF